MRPVILSADDDKQIVDSHRNIMKRYGFEIRYTTKLKNMKKAIEANEIDCIHTDILFDPGAIIPDYNKPNGLSELRNILQGRTDIPVMVISGYIDEEAKKKAKEYGISDAICKWYPKPVDYDLVAMDTIKAINQFKFKSIDDKNKIKLKPELLLDKLDNLLMDILVHPESGERGFLNFKYVIKNHTWDSFNDRGINHSIIAKLLVSAMKMVKDDVLKSEIAIETLIAIKKILEEDKLSNMDVFKVKIKLEDIFGVSLDQFNSLLNEAMPDEKKLGSILVDIDYSEESIVVDAILEMHEKYPHIFIIPVSGYHKRKFYLMEAYKNNLKIIDWLQKPYNEKKMMESIGKVIKNNYVQKKFNQPITIIEAIISTDLLKILGKGKTVSLKIKMLCDPGFEISCIPTKVIKIIESKIKKKLPYGMRTVEYFGGELFAAKTYFLSFQSNDFGDVNKMEFLEINDDIGIIGRDVLGQKDYIEEKIRKSVSNKLYEEGRNYLIEVIKHMPESEERLIDEFGYIYGELKTPIEKERIRWRQRETQIDWRRKVWRIMSIWNTSEFERLSGEKKDKGEQEKFGDDEKTKNATDKTGAKKTSEGKGEELENAVKILFKHFFTLCGDTLVVKEVRQQKRGSQFGFDIKVISETNSKQTIRLLVECKNYSESVKKKDVAEKLIEVEAYNEEIPIDHWILISPNADVTNDLDKLLDLWEKKGKYPFKIQFWTPATKVDEFFGILPEVYDQIIQNPDNKNHPRTWSKEKTQEVLDFWKGKLAPPIKLPTGWEGYLRDSVKLLLEGESKELFEELYDRHVTMMCKDESGTMFKVEEKVMEWLVQPIDRSPSMFLLGEFGDGKTFFTYVLCRKLIKEFLKSPSNGWIPVRFALKDFGMKKDDIVRDFVRRRLEEFGADIEGWTTLKRNNYKLLAILDGFDEMSKELDNETVKRNIENLIVCHKNEFKDVKLLITSRKHFFELQTEKKRLLSRIGNPQLLHLTPINRKTTENYLKEYAQRIGAGDKFSKLKQCHDPIDIASKPLFLDMVQTSLKDLPEGDFSEFILYETYIQKSLERKIEFLEDRGLITFQEDIIDNLKGALEDVGLKLFEYNRAFIYLSETHNELAERLWQISQLNDNIREDAMARISSRSLLKPMGKDGGSKGKKWPVDFCHRSMREYFVARKICNLLRTDDLSEAERLLRFHGLNHEIVYFASQIMKNTDFEYEVTLMALIEKTRGLNENALLDARRLGGNAVNLLYQYKGELPNSDWSKLVLDGAKLAEADLSGKNFSHTSLVSANLDNVNFENSDFSFSNLTNIRFEETAPVQAIAVSPSEELFALYNDGVIREWNFQGMPTPAVSFAENKNEKAIKFFAYPASGFTVIEDDRLTFLDRVDDKLQQRATFEIDPNQKLLKVSQQYLLLLKEKSSKEDILKLFDLESEKEVSFFEVPKYSLCEYLDRDGFVIYNEKKGLQILDMTDKRKSIIDIKIELEEKITCITTCHCKESLKEFLLGVGHKNGVVQVWKIKLPKFEPSFLFKHKSHEGVVKDISFIDEERIISGGIDSKLKLLTFDLEAGKKYDPKVFKIKLRCKGMKIEGVEREHERKLLEGFISKAE
jgi:FixJ family two-component response regulator